VKKYSKRSSSFDQLPGLREPLYDERKRLVPIKGLVWRLNSVSGGLQHALNWGLFPTVPREIAEAFLAFMRHNVATKSNYHCVNIFRQLVRLAESYQRNGDDGMRSFLLRTLAELRSQGSEWRFHYARDWYRWCSEQNLPGFDSDELLYELISLRIPGNKKGEAVLSEDPEEGPLDDLEEIALRAALHRDTGSLLERVLTWAFLSLGCNPKNLVYLWEQDYKYLVNGEHSFFTLDVPRIKKGAHPRLELKTRKLDASMAALFEQLIASNQRLGIPPGFARPLFARRTPRAECLGTAIEEFAYHFTSHDLADIVTGYVSRLGVISHRTGKPLYVTPRRLRYRFATKKVQEGCPMEVLKELLDHSDLQHVIVYYAGTSMTKRLDEALAVSVGPVVNRFMGRVVASEADALNGGGRIKAHPMGRIRNIGSCGSKSLCTLFPPFSCYLCPLFQPWRDAPHREVLEDLVRQRDERIAAAGRDDDRIAKQYDEIIVTVGQVVALCEGSSK
jgi:hypothetical protein